MGMFTAAAVLVVGMASAAAPGPEEIAVREAVVEALREAVGDHTEPLEVIELEVDEQWIASLPEHQFVSEGRALGDRELRVRIADLDVESFRCSFGLNMMFASWETQDPRYWFILRLKDEWNQYATRDPHSHRWLRDVFYPVLEKEAWPDAAAEFRAMISEDLDQREYDELLHSVTLDDLKAHIYNSTQSTFFTHALAYYCAAKLSALGHESDSPVLSLRGPSGTRWYFYPVVGHDTTAGYLEYLQYEATTTLGQSEWRVRAFIIPLHDQSNRAEREQMMLIMASAAEHVFEQIRPEQLAPVEPPPPSP